MKSIAFNMGNSTTGPIGAVIRVVAKDRAEAVAAANRGLEHIGTVLARETGLPSAIEYFNVYITENIRAVVSASTCLAFIMI